MSGKGGEELFKYLTKSVKREKKSVVRGVSKTTRHR